MDHHYAIYGVSVASDTPLPFQPHVDLSATAPRVRFNRGLDDEFPVRSCGGAHDGWFVCQALDDATYLRCSTFYEFLVDSGGAEVKYRPLEDGHPIVLHNFLFGAALSFALVRQGVEPLHAAVVDIGDGAIALLGDCTFGKSTLAGFFLQAGCRLLTDDLLVVHEQEGQSMAAPGAGRIKLQPDAARVILGRDALGTMMNPQTDKQVFHLHDARVSRSERPLRAFLVLPTPEERTRSERIEIERLRPAELFHELVKASFVSHIEDAARLRRNFSCNTRLATAVEAYRLRYPAGIDRLASVRNAVLSHLRHRAGSAQ
jgi:hypothetical protein